jgi:hypothetical protein
MPSQQNASNPAGTLPLARLNTPIGSNCTLSGVIQGGINTPTATHPNRQMHADTHWNCASFSRADNVVQLCGMLSNRSRATPVACHRSGRRLDSWLVLLQGSGSMHKQGMQGVSDCARGVRVRLYSYHQKSEGIRR